MSLVLSRLLVMLLPVAGLAFGVGFPTSTQAATTPTTFVTMTSETGDYIGGGAHRMWRPGAGSVSVSGSVGSQITVNVSGGPSGDYFTMTFAAPPGQTLKPGTYLDAQRTPFRTAGHPGIDIFGDGRGCNTTSGRFTVLDVGPLLSRLWLVYEQHCSGRDPALFGEIRYKQPAGDSELLVAPGRISWPDEYPGVGGRIVPVTLVNTGTKPVTLSQAAVTEGGSEFSVAGNTCSSLSVGAACTVYVGFKPTSRGPRAGTLTIRDSTSTGSHTVALDGAGISGTTSWDMQSQPGDYIGQGRHWHYTPADSTIVASGDESHVQLRVDGGSTYWTADFEADSAHLLLPGTAFTGATRYPFNTTAEPGLTISGDGRGCNKSTGTFTVQEAEYTGGQVTKFLVNFEQHCEGATAALFGTITWRAGDTTPPSAPVTNLVASPGLGAVALSWNDPSDSTKTVVSGAPGLVPPRYPTSGSQVYAGTDGQVTVTGLASGSAYSYTVFPLDASGNVGPGVSVTVRGTALTLTASTNFLGKTTLSGRLKDAQSGAALGQHPVTVQSRRQGTVDWSTVATRTTAANGNWSWSVQPGTPTEYQVRYAGSGNHLGSTAGPVLVKK